ncbi:MAG: YybH family protein [Kiloniellales bacterium]
MNLAEQKATGPEAQIRAAIEDWSGALRAKDAKRVVAHHAPNYVQFSLAPPLISDAAVAEGLEAWFATWQGPLRHEVRDLSILASADTAFCHGLARLGGTKTGGEKPDIWFRLTLGLRKVGGAWKIVHEHESVPFYMDGSYKAAVDLKP